MSHRRLSRVSRLYFLPFVPVSMMKQMLAKNEHESSTHVKIRATPTNAFAAGHFTR
jgi:hypothetical protein